MARKTPVVLPLATALAALGGTVIGNAPAKATTVVIDEKPTTGAAGGTEHWNRFVTAGKDILGFTVTDNADGTMLAQHGSHYSHSSHASHASSRY